MEEVYTGISLSTLLESTSSTLLSERAARDNVGCYRERHEGK
jgi:hypothetical protein